MHTTVRSLSMVVWTHFYSQEHQSNTMLKTLLRENPEVNANDLVTDTLIEN